MLDIRDKKQDCPKYEVPRTWYLVAKHKKQDIRHKTRKLGESNAFLTFSTDFTDLLHADFHRSFASNN